MNDDDHLILDYQWLSWESIFYGSLDVHSLIDQVPNRAYCIVLTFVDFHFLLFLAHIVSFAQFLLLRHCSRAFFYMLTNAFETGHLVALDICSLALLIPLTRSAVLHRFELAPLTARLLT